jgi:hypothetical protein
VAVGLILAGVVLLTSGTGAKTEPSINASQATTLN